MPGEPNLIYNDSPGAIPATYEIPPGLELELESVFARFEGAAAAATFLACFSVYSQDERLIARVFPSQRLAVGDQGRVTFAPF